MSVVEVVLDGKQLVTWDGFHTECADGLGFPEFYGRNRDAWIDCVSDIGGGLMRAELQAEAEFLIVIESSAAWAAAAPEIVIEFVQLLEAVHMRLREAGSMKQIGVVFR